jgi:large subunit ribosomal protein L36e
VREIIREVSGFSPLEKKMLELIRTGVASKEKKAVKHARAKLGTHRRAILRRDAISNIIQQQRRKN